MIWKGRNYFPQLQLRFHPCSSLSMFQACKYAKASFIPSCTRDVPAPPEFQAVKLSVPHQGKVVLIVY